MKRQMINKPYTSPGYHPTKFSFCLLSPSGEACTVKVKLLIGWCPEWPLYLCAKIAPHPYASVAGEWPWESISFWGLVSLALQWGLQLNGLNSRGAAIPLCLPRLHKLVMFSQFLPLVKIMCGFFFSPLRKGGSSLRKYKGEDASKYCICPVIAWLASALWSLSWAEAAHTVMLEGWALEPAGFIGSAWSSCHTIPWA